MSSTSAFDGKYAYFPAKSSSTGGNNSTSTAAAAADDFTNVTYKPTPAECATLTEPIDYFLSQCSCYDMIGMSTQVVVLDTEAPLAVAFIAAQETRVQSCVLWDPRARQFVGVLSSTDYIKILLYCGEHPEEAEKVSCWTIRHWRDVNDKVINPSLEASGAQVAGSSSPKPRPAALVTCQADTSLRDCLAQMKDFHVRRIVALAEKEAASFSVVAMIDVAHIVEYLGVMFFHIEKAGGTLWQHPVPVNSNNRAATTPAPAPTMMMMGVRSNTTTAPTSAAASTGPSSPLGGKGGNGGKDSSSTSSGRGGVGGVEAPSSSGATTTAAAVGGDGIYSLGEVMLPPHVSSILAQAKSSEAAAAKPRVGPYRSIFDIPFCNLPAGVGAHKATPICVTLESRLNDALRLMLWNDIESIAVCSSEERGIIVDVISRSDLLRMENQGVYDTSCTVREALATKAREHIFVIYEKDTLRDIFAHFVRRRVKELFFVDPDTGKLRGQLNVTEFVFFLVFAHMADEKTTPRPPAAPAAAATHPG